MAIRKIKRGYKSFKDLPNYGYYGLYPYLGETYEEYTQRMRIARSRMDPEARQIIKEHHEATRNNPDSLSTDVIQGLVGRTCSSKSPALYSNNKCGIVTEDELLEDHKKFMKKSNRYGRYVDSDYEFRKKKRIKSKPKRKVCRCK